MTDSRPSRWESACPSPDAVHIPRIRRREGGPSPLMVRSSSSGVRRVSRAVTRTSATPLGHKANEIIQITVAEQAEPQHAPSGGNIINGCSTVPGRIWESAGHAPAKSSRNTISCIAIAQLSGDRIAAEKLCQHAEHYTGCWPRRCARWIVPAKSRKQWNANASLNVTGERAQRLRAQKMPERPRLCRSTRYHG